MVLSRKVLTGSVSLDDAGLAVPRWLRQARPLVAQIGVTGGLVFDGERWLQLLEGEATAIDALLATMSSHAALGQRQLLHADTGDLPERLCANWLIGYVEPEDLSALQEQMAVDALAAVQALVVLLVGADSG
jgi:hypothetical protein